MGRERELRWAERERERTKVGRKRERELRWAEREREN